MAGYAAAGKEATAAHTAAAMLVAKIARMTSSRGVGCWLKPSTTRRPDGAIGEHRAGEPGEPG
ncbi:hypothetical protein GCM10010170_012600 [Dactylosporangium salmoneum]|uniref:Uncharacterized protein n=1 Tax=Dactylosporangium salmoneum TaxID=53361 RepID=A0ABP5SP73_9ACTN